MMLADLGADVVRVARPGDAAAGLMASTADETPTERMIRGHRKIDVVSRGRRLVEADLKHPDGLATVLDLIEQSDVLIEGFRPGVAERLGIGPDACLDRNPRLVYARITGWGQDGPFAQVPGHDINYVALSGALDALRRDLIGLSADREELLRGQSRPQTWAAGKARLAAVFKGKTLAQWSDLLEGTDTCFAPVLTLEEAPRHPHNATRGTFIEVNGITQPAPAPRFSRTPAGRPS
jgi:crotonobetainyl-CoA:carnitine CoA-transferase CaiB-like acyl-CoA transferase